MPTRSLAMTIQQTPPLWVLIKQEGTAVATNTHTHTRVTVHIETQANVCMGYLSLRTRLEIKDKTKELRKWLILKLKVLEVKNVQITSRLKGTIQCSQCSHSFHGQNQVK